MIASTLVIGFLSLVSLMGPSAKADQTQVPPDFALAKALPQEVMGWQKGEEDQVYNRDDIFDYLDGAGELYLAFDFRFVFVKEYTKPDAPSIVVEIYQMSSSADAYGIYTQDTDGQEVRLGQDALYGAGLLRFWKDKIFVRVMADRETPDAKEAVMKLGGAIDAAVAEAGPKPEILGRLPVEGLEPRTVRFFHTVISLNSFYFMSNVNILNLAPQTQAVMARYEKGRARGTLILVEYPSEDKAYSAYGRFIEMYLLERFVPDREFPPVELENKKYAGAVRAGRCLALAVEADDKATAEDLLKRAAANF
jgi:Family of unknown function (DUF6599)